MALFRFGISLIEILIVIVVFAIISTVSVSAYRDYIARTEVASALESSKSLQEKVQYLLSVRGDCVTEPPTIYGGSNIIGRYSIVRYNLADCGLLLEFKGPEFVNAGLANHVLALRITLQDGNYVWTCESTLIDNIRPKTCAYNSALTL